MRVKNIILDLGGVLLNIDYHLTITAFKKLGIKNFDELYSQANQNSLFDDFETGHISAQQFINGISNYLPKTTTEEEILQAWNAMLLDFPEERLNFLSTLKKQYNLVLLSNTNTLHLDFFHKQLLASHGVSSLDAYFNTTYFSCDMGMRKPHPEIFLQVCSLEGYIHSETLFIDDSIQHVAGAKEAGLHAYHLDVKENNVINLLRSLLA